MGKAFIEGFEVEYEEKRWNYRIWKTHRIRKNIWMVIDVGIELHGNYQYSFEFPKRGREKIHDVMFRSKCINLMVNEVIAYLVKKAAQ